ncbi:MAG: isocitrate lyase/PEP mutase family protein [Anaerolineae bacterium]|nr:isocitrate lyase/PEP mutase family protein [Anaerolineae bacterium]
MTAQIDRARQFAALHVKGDPLVLYNIWDAGSALAVAEAGARALATGSACVAAAQGYTDGENLPLELVVANLQRIARRVDLPVSLDFESGYARDPDTIRQNVAQVIAAGAIGVNFEDQNIREDVLYPLDEQVKRVAAVRQAADDAGIPLFINARTDIFLNAKPAEHSAEHLAAALDRATAFAEAGASGFFAPGLRDGSLIEKLCATCTLPVNVLAHPDSLPQAQLASLGVARISHGPFPYRRLIDLLKIHARDVLA